MAIPVIYKHELIENNGIYTLRLYIKGDDIGLGVVKIYAGRSSSFICESVGTDGTYSLPWGSENAYKTADIPVSENKTYRFSAALYSPWYEDSGLSELYSVDVTEISV